MHAIRSHVLLPFILLGLTVTHAMALDYPAKPVRILVGFIGGSGDLATRALASELQTAWKQPVIVENRAGAGGLIAYEATARSAPDGHTLMQAGAAWPIFHLLIKDLRFDPLKDLTLVAMFGENLNMFATNSMVPAKNFKEFLAYAKANPEKLNYASLGRSYVGLAAETFKYITGTTFTEIAYKGSPDALNGLARNDTQLIYNPIVNLRPFIEKGLVRPLFVIAKARVAEFPDIPTNAEVGLEKLTPRAWQGIVAPSATPRDVVFKINSDIGIIVTRADFQNLLKKAGFEPLTLSIPEIRTFIDEEVARMTAATKNANIRPE